MRPIDSYRFDLLARLFINGFRLTPTRGVIAAYAASTLLGVIGFSLTGTLVSPSGEVDYSRGLVFVVWAYIFAPVLVYSYLWISDSINVLTLKLQASATVVIYDEDVKSVQKLYGLPWRECISVLAGVVSGVVYFVSRSDLPHTSAELAISRTVVTIPAFLGGYVMSIVVLTHITNIVAIKTLIGKNKFHLNPLHPDNCGGLRVLSDYAVRVAYLAAACGLVIGLSEYRFITFGLAQKYWFIHLSIPAYIVIAVISFLAPLYVAHGSMRRAREELLFAIAQQFQEDYLHVQLNLKEPASQLESDVARIKHIQTVYALTSEFHVWPVDTGTLRRFLTTLAAPLVPVAIGVLAQILQNLFLR